MNAKQYQICATMDNASTLLAHTVAYAIKDSKWTIPVLTAEVNKKSTTSHHSRIILGRFPLQISTNVFFILHLANTIARIPKAATRAPVLQDTS